MKCILHQATAEDIDVLDRLHTENMKGYVEKVYPWNPTLFKDNFIPQDYRVIKYSSKIIGFLKVVLSKNDIYLAEIQIISNYQNRGIGTSVIKDIIVDAKLNHQRLWLRVIKGNPVEQLYKRLGFTVFETSLTHNKMEIKQKARSPVKTKSR